MSVSCRTDESSYLDACMGPAATRIERPPARAMQVGYNPPRLGGAGGISRKRIVDRAARFERQVVRTVYARCPHGTLVRILRALDIGSDRTFAI